MDSDTRLALALLRSEPRLAHDARTLGRNGNSLAGSLLTRPIGPIGARSVAEAAVRRALSILDQER